MLDSTTVFAIFVVIVAVIMLITYRTPYCEHYATRPNTPHFKFDHPSAAQTTAYYKMDAKMQAAFNDSGPETQLRVLKSYM